jgi:hypothetical protein
MALRLLSDMPQRPCAHNVVIDDIASGPGRLRPLRLTTVDRPLKILAFCPSGLTAQPTIKILRTIDQKFSV